VKKKGKRGERKTAYKHAQASHIQPVNNRRRSMLTRKVSSVPGTAARVERMEHLLLEHLMLSPNPHF